MKFVISSSLACFGLICCQLWFWRCRHFVHFDVVFHNIFRIFVWSIDISILRKWVMMTAIVNNVLVKNGMNSWGWKVSCYLVYQGNSTLSMVIYGCDSVIGWEKGLIFTSVGIGNILMCLKYFAFWQLFCGSDCWSFKFESIWPHETASCLKWSFSYSFDYYCFISVFLMF